MSGRGPIRLISPRRTLTKLGSSSRRDFRRIAPSGLIRCSSSASSWPRFDTSQGAMVRNFQMRKGTPPCPMRSWRKKTGPGLKKGLRIKSATATNAMIGKATSENWISTIRLKIRTRRGQSATCDPLACSTCARSNAWRSTSCKDMYYSLAPGVKPAAFHLNHYRQFKTPNAQKTLSNAHISLSLWIAQYLQCNWDKFFCKSETVRFRQVYAQKTPHFRRRAYLVGTDNRMPRCP